MVYRFSSRLRSRSGTCESLALLAGIVAVLAKLPIFRPLNEKINYMDVSDVIKKVPYLRESCPNCGLSKPWAVIYADKYQLLSSTRPGKGSMPLTMVVCQRCGFSQFFSSEGVDTKG